MRWCLVVPDIPTWYAQSTLVVDHTNSLQQHSLSSTILFTAITTTTTTAELWRDADAVVEDVMGGICISLLLPSIDRVAVKLVSSRVVAVEAVRLVLPDEGDYPFPVSLL